MSKGKKGTESPDERPLSRAEVRDAMSVLDQAYFSYCQWVDDLNVTLICRLRPDDRDVSPEAHRNCRFGQWYYGDATRGIRDNPNFAELEDAHRMMHQHAAHLLTLSAEGHNIPITDYEHFVHELKRMNLQIETLKRELEDHIHNVDTLTGASSRVGMLGKLREQHELVKRKLETCVVVMMDIDKFKQVNDTYGHSIGDRALVTFAQHVMRNIRPFDRLFRYGGEEFILCAPHTDLNGARDMIERIRSRLSDIEIVAEGFEPFRITASFGIAALEPDVAVADSIDRADRALYAAKSGGRNRTVVWDASIATRKAS